MSAWKLNLNAARMQLAGAIRATTGSLQFRADHSAIDIFADAVVEAYRASELPEGAGPVSSQGGKNTSAEVPGRASPSREVEWGGYPLTWGDEG